MVQVSRSFRIFGKFTVGKPGENPIPAQVKGNCLEILHVRRNDGDTHLDGLARVRLIKDAADLPELPGRPPARH